MEVALIETLIVVLIVLWLLGFFGSRRGLRVPRTGTSSTSCS